MLKIAIIQIKKSSIKMIFINSKIINKAVKYCLIKNNFNLKVLIIKMLLIDKMLLITMIKILITKINSKIVLK